MFVLTLVLLICTSCFHLDINKQDSKKRILKYEGQAGEHVLFYFGSDNPSKEEKEITKYLNEKVIKEKEAEETEVKEKVEEIENPIK